MTFPWKLRRARPDAQAKAACFNGISVGKLKDIEQDSLAYGPGESVYSPTTNLYQVEAGYKYAAPMKKRSQFSGIALSDWHSTPAILEKRAVRFVEGRYRILLVKGDGWPNFSVLPQHGLVLSHWEQAGSCLTDQVKL